MQASKAITIWLEYHKSHSKENTLKAYQMVLSNFNQEFGEKNIQGITSDEVLPFLNRITEGTKQQTKRTHFWLGYPFGVHAVHVNLIYFES